MKGRDFASYLKLLPGVVDTSAREAPGWGSMGGLSINGRSGGFNFSYDGVTNKDTGSNSGNYAAPALDSIAEVRVQTSNFQAEYGRSSGATDHRHHPERLEGLPRQRRLLQARRCLERQRVLPAAALRTGRRRPSATRRTTISTTRAWTLGGPVLIPGHVASTAAATSCSSSCRRTCWRRTDPGGLQERRMPTELERRGDFSQSFDNQGRPLFIRDPQLAGNCNVTTGGPACFPGNVIPANRINAIGAARCSTCSRCPTRRRSTTELQQLHVPDRAGLAAQRPGAAHGLQHRAEHHDVRPVAVRLREARRPASRSSARAAAGRSSRASTRSTRSATSTRCSTPSTRRSIREVTVGVNWAHQYTSAFDDAARDANDRRIVLPGFPQFFPQANPDGILPNATFNGGTPGTVALVQHRQPLAVLRLQHAVELLRQHHEDHRLAQHQGRAVRRAHDPSGAARRRPTTAR